MKKLVGIMLVLSLVVVSCKGGESVKKGTSEQKLCALTFDDGPNPDMTPKVLDKLEKYKVVATFFVIGMLVNEDTKPILTRMVKMGCEIGNHSWAWDPLNSMPKEKIKESVEKTTKAIKQYSGQTPKFFRPPNLAVSDVMYEVIDMPFVSGVLGYDWAGCDRTVNKISENLEKILNFLVDCGINSLGNILNLFGVISWEKQFY